VEPEGSAQHFALVWSLVRHYHVRFWIVKSNIWILWSQCLLLMMGLMVDSPNEAMIGRPCFVRTVGMRNRRRRKRDLGV
jgi:hypothetical protein